MVHRLARSTSKHKPWERMSVRVFSALWLCSFTILAGACAAAVSCSPSQGKDEATDLVRVMTDLRMANNAEKRGYLERLRGFSCKNTEVCEARNACLEAFAHHVRGVEIGVTLKKHLDNDSSSLNANELNANELNNDGLSGDKLRAEDKSALLLEMNIEIEEGKNAMPLCDQKMEELRKHHKI